MLLDTDKERLAFDIPIISFDIDKDVPSMEPRQIESAKTGYKKVMRRLRDIFRKVGKHYNTKDYHIAVGSICGISADIIRQIISPYSKKGPKVLTPVILGSICIGLKLSEDECDYLFSEFGIQLVFGKSMFTSITACAIRDKDNVEEYINELRKYKIPGTERLINETLKEKAYKEAVLLGYYDVEFCCVYEGKEVYVMKTLFEQYIGLNHLLIYKKGKFDRTTHKEALKIITNLERYKK